MLDVFINRSSRDWNAACALLGQRGIQFWIAPRDIRAGSPPCMGS